MLSAAILCHVAMILSQAQISGRTPKSEVT